MMPCLTGRGNFFWGLLAVGLSIASPARGSTITVNSTADPGSAGICTLRDAITAANTNTAVNGCPAGMGADIVDLSGVSGMIPLTGLLTITSKMTIAGPGAPNLTISGGNATQVFSVSSTGNLTLDNVTISSGSGFPNGAIANAGTLAVNGCTFYGNNAADGGGAILNVGKLTVSNSAFSTNSAGTSGGGAIFNGVCGKGNCSTGKCKSCPLKITSCTFMNNGPIAINVSGQGYPAKIGKVTVSGSTFLNNGNALGYGGAIHNEVAKLVVTRSTFLSNSAASGGGAIYNALCGGTANSCPLIITNSTFAANSSSGYGGAIYNDGNPSSGGTTSVTNCTFSANSANAYGSALWAWGKLKVQDSTIANNGPAGAIDSCNPGTYPKCIAILKNTLLANNNGASCQTIPVDGGHNLEDSATCGFTGTGCSSTKGTSLCNATPMIDPSGPQDNGGPTQTIAVEAGSPAIDAAGCSPRTDQRGYKRPGIDAMTANPYKHCTIGAHEYNSPGCPGKLTACGAQSICTNIKKDPANCGACGTVCAPGQVCSKGICH